MRREKEVPAVCDKNFSFLNLDVVFTD